MQIEMPFHTKTITVNLPDKATILRTSYPEPENGPAESVELALRQPVVSPPLSDLIKSRRPGHIVIVVSDITRPIPYPAFLPNFIDQIEAAGVTHEDILILIATGMHRLSTEAERLEILGQSIVSNYRIEDHMADASDLLECPIKSWSGNIVKLNRRFVEAGFRIVTGLVEPHFMAGFSGGRKAVCPGLASLETVQQFHGYDFLANPRADNARLEGNPCHLEALSVARAVGVDFSLNVVLNHKREIIRAYTGELDAAFRVACEFVQKHANPVLDQEYDVVLTSSAGYPLDTTFYQCIKGLTSVLPAVKSGGHMISIGGCAEGIGSENYKKLLFKYADNYKKFLQDISSTKEVLKDQWQFQMQTRALEKIGADHIHFFTDAIKQDELDQLSCHGISTTNVQDAVQRKINEFVEQGKSICATPEGPYCSPVIR